MKTTRAEKSVGYNLEFNYKKKLNNGGALFINQAFFLTYINHPVIGRTDQNNQVSFINETSPVVSKVLTPTSKEILMTGNFT